MIPPIKLKWEFRIMTNESQQGTFQTLKSTKLLSKAKKAIQEKREEKKKVKQKQI